ncbi:MAG: hypothetical protein OYM47_13690 [Gemmatimonadota bacterium]|nr:hypothetical protein [Gemmatimonadota bacterium]
MPELPRMYPVWVDAKNTRVYGMDVDECGALWFTGSLSVLHRYNPESGQIHTFSIPDKHGGSQCLCAGGKVYVLPQTNPMITVYDTVMERVYKIDKPFLEANLWYGHADKARNVLYLPERSRPCLVVWDVETEEGEVLEYPAPGVLPDIREVDWPERLETFAVPRNDGVQRRVYYDPDSRGFLAEDSRRVPPSRPGARAEPFVVSYSDGRLSRLDRRTGERYERDVPGWKEDFGFIGGGVFYRGWQLNNLSTYDSGFRYDEKTGDYIQQKEDPHIGVDGLPYHFMDRFIAYHPESDTFDLLIPDVPRSRYPQLCYNKVADGHLYITANDIWSEEKQRPLGAVENPVGQLMVLQTRRTDGG